LSPKGTPPKGVFVHEKGICESEDVGEGTRIWAFAHVMKGSRIGRACNIGEGSFIESGAVLGDHCTVKNGVAVWDKVTCEDYVFLGPDVALTNDFLPRAAFKKDPETEFRPTRIREGASIGANATIVCGITLGEYSFIGAGAVVTSDVPPYALMVGVPARRVGWMCRCGERLQVRDKSARCGACGTAYREDQGGLSVIDRPQTQG
jgi:acetyltransferase-like isoleucine patch superfamily enzyme